MPDNNDQQNNDPGLMGLADQENESDTRSSDEIYQETRRDSGGVETDEGEFQPPAVPEVDGEPDTPFDERNEDFRQFWRTRLAGKGYGYEYHRPGLKFGYQLAYSSEYSTDEWAEIEDDAREMWEDANPDYDWDEFEVLVKHGWNMGTQYQRDVEIDNPLIKEGTSAEEAQQNVLEDEGEDD